MNVTVNELDELSLRHERSCPIASRCGVLPARATSSPSQPGRPEGGRGGLYLQAVVDQTVVSLTQGRELKGKIVFLGGPLHFLMGLQQRFVETLKLDADRRVPRGRRLLPPLWARPCAPPTTASAPLTSAGPAGEERGQRGPGGHHAPSLTAARRYDAFLARHNAMHPPRWTYTPTPAPPGWGIDLKAPPPKSLIPPTANCSTPTTTQPGQPGGHRAEQLRDHKLCGDASPSRARPSPATARTSSKNAFSCDAGLVETLAYNAARHFQPDVDFIIDIGSQDMKCFKIRNGAVDSIMLSEACSSGCGSASSRPLPRPWAHHRRLCQSWACWPKHRSTWGRCTVFANSASSRPRRTGPAWRTHLRGIVHLHRQERGSTRSSGPPTPTIWALSWCRAAPSTTTRCSGPSSRSWAATSPGPPSQASWAPSAQPLRQDLHLEKEALLSEALQSFSHTAKPTTCNLACTQPLLLTVNTFDGGPSSQATAAPAPWARARWRTPI